MTRCQNGPVNLLRPLRGALFLEHRQHLPSTFCRQATMTRVNCPEPILHVLYNLLIIQKKIIWVSFSGNMA